MILTTAGRVRRKRRRTQSGCLILTRGVSRWPSPRTTNSSPATLKFEHNDSGTRRVLCGHAAFRRPPHRTFRRRGSRLALVPRLSHITLSRRLVLDDIPPFPRASCHECRQRASDVRPVHHRRAHDRCRSGHPTVQALGMGNLPRWQTAASAAPGKRVQDRTHRDISRQGCAQRLPVWSRGRTTRRTGCGL
jgi:hypothetical protein